MAQVYGKLTGRPGVFMGQGPFASTTGAFGISKHQPYGLYRIELSDYRQVNDGTLGFRRVDVHLQQFVPLMRENWVIALHARLTTTDTHGGNDVPFYLMPSLPPQSPCGI